MSDNAGAAAAQRKQEAYTLAQHIQHIARSQKGMPLLVFGDWNDGPSDAAPQILQEGLSADAALRRLSPKDSRGEEWTLYFKRGKEYCILRPDFCEPHPPRTHARPGRHRRFPRRLQSLRPPRPLVRFASMQA